MAEFSANALQTVNPGESVVFNTNPVPCTRGFIRHRDDTGTFLLSGWVPTNFTRRCCCSNNNGSAIYLAEFGANIAVPTGETVGPISVAFALDGTTIPSSTMISTPAAVEEFNNISTRISIPIWKGCCETFSITNTSTIPILVQNANVVFSRPDLTVSR